MYAYNIIMVENLLTNNLKKKPTQLITYIFEIHNNIISLIINLQLLLKNWYILV